MIHWPKRLTLIWRVMDVRACKRFHVKIVGAWWFSCPVCRVSKDKPMSCTCWIWLILATCGNDCWQFSGLEWAMTEVMIWREFMGLDKRGDKAADRGFLWIFSFLSLVLSLKLTCLFHFLPRLQRWDWHRCETKGYSDVEIRGHVIHQNSWIRQECPTAVSHKRLLQERSHRSVLESVTSTVCFARVAYKSVIRKTVLPGFRHLDAFRLVCIHIMMGQELWVRSSKQSQAISCDPSRV